MQPVIDRDGIRRIHGIIRARVRRTPIVEIDAADFGLEMQARLVLKLELLQHAGSFKARGAFAHLLGRKVPAAGVAAASGGNHGAAVAFAARRLGIPARIFVPTVASPAKVRQIRDDGAELVVQGERYADALAECDRWVESSGALALHAYDQPETMLGQGTLGLELEEQAPDLDALLIAVGGGGLIGGVAAWYADDGDAVSGRTAPRGRPRIVGVEPERAPTLTRALEAGRPVDTDVSGVAADSLGARRVGDLMFPIAQRSVERMVLVSDDAIRRAQEALWRVLRVAAEPGGAAALAAILSGGWRPGAGERVGIVVCGGNTSAVDFKA